MIQVSGKLVTAIFIFFSIAIILQGVFSYHYLSLKPATYSNNIFIAQSIFFSSLVLSLLLVATGYRLLIHSKSIDQELDKLGDGADQSSYVALRAQQNLGRLGLKINRIVNRVVSFSDLQKRHISAQSNLINYCCSRSNDIYFVTTIKGHIKFISHGAILYFNLEGRSHSALSLLHLVAHFNLKRAIIQLMSAHSSYSDAGLTVYPIADYSDPPYYLFFTLTEDSFSKK